MIVSIIAAINGPMRVIGKSGKIPWTCSKDVNRFSKLTIGFPVIMGRVTFESFGCKDGLPERDTIVVSNHGKFEYGSRVTVVNSLAAALEKCRRMNVNECFVIGGASMYREALSMDEVDRIYLTIIPGEYDGDTFFPAIDFNDWSLMSKDETSDCTYMIFGRKSVAGLLGKRSIDANVHICSDGIQLSSESSGDLDAMSVDDLENEMNDITTATVSVVNDEYANDISVLADIMNVPDGLCDVNDDSVEDITDVMCTREHDIADLAQVILHLIDDVSYLVNQADLEGSEARAIQNSIMLISTMLSKHGTAINNDRSDINLLIGEQNTLMTDMGELGQNAITISDMVIKLKKTTQRLVGGLIFTTVLAVSSFILQFLLK